MGDVPVMREYSSQYGMWDNQWFVDTKKIKINLLTELKVVYLQIANLYRRFCIDGPQAYKFLRETTTAEAANAAKMRFIETMINDKNVARKEVEKFLFEYLENSWMHMNFENIEDRNVRTVRISECFWEENLAELKKRCNKNPKMKKALIDTATKTFRELLIQMKGQDRQSGQCKILHRSSIKYLKDIKVCLQQLGFKDTPLIKAARPKRAAAKAKQKKVVGTKEKIKGAKEHVGDKTAKAMKKAKSFAGKKVLTAANKTAGRKTITSAGTKLVIGAGVTGVVFGVAGFILDTSPALGGDFYDARELVTEDYRNQYSQEEFNEAVELYTGLYKPKKEMRECKWFFKNLDIFTEIAIAKKEGKIKLRGNKLKMWIDLTIAEGKIYWPTQTRFDCRKCH